MLFSELSRKYEQSAKYNISNQHADKNLKY
jgi:hypothetical protein